MTANEREEYEGYYGPDDAWSDLEYADSNAGWSAADMEPD